jgi:hypothetical protein
LFRGYVHYHKKDKCEQKLITLSPGQKYFNALKNFKKRHYDPNGDGTYGSDRNYGHRGDIMRGIHEFVEKEKTKGLAKISSMFQKK